MKRNNCMFAIPHEITGIGTLCGLGIGVCNNLGRRCLGYKPHTPESRKALADAIAAVKLKRKQQKGAAK